MCNVCKSSNLKLGKQIFLYYWTIKVVINISLNFYLLLLYHRTFSLLYIYHLRLNLTKINTQKLWKTLNTSHPLSHIPHSHILELANLIHWTYESPDSFIFIVFIASLVKYDSLISWAINSIGINMLESHTLIAFKELDSWITINT